MGEQDSKGEEIILPLLALIEEQLVENLAQRLTLDLLWEWFPKGKHEGENLSWEPLIGQHKRELAPRVAEKFRGIRDRLFVELGHNPQRLDPNWLQKVERLIESVRDIDLPE